VTSALELEIGTDDVDRWYAEREGKALIHHGVSIGHPPVRMAVLGDPVEFLPPASSRASRNAATEAEIAEIRRRIERGLRRGAPAVGFGLQYTAAAAREEVLEAFRAAAAFGAPCHVHLRHGGTKEPESCVAGLEEVLAASASSGAPLHVVHLHSTSVAWTPRTLKAVADARARGVDVTAECYPYTAGMTRIQSAIFDGDWRASRGIDYADLLWPPTGERLTEETFLKYRKIGGLVAVFSIPEEAVRAALADPEVIVGSDGIREGGSWHPRSAGTCARVLGRYVREEKVLTLMDAVRKMSLLPARRLERRAPVFRDKGRIRPGADADLTLFDPATVIDRATYEKPTEPSAGIRHVLVGGIAVVRDGRLVPDVLPGRALRAPLRD
jgi:N-acyl-D-aspartate/D-glutamate deacylase